METVYVPEQEIDVCGTPYIQPAHWEAALYVGHGAIPRKYVGRAATKREAILAAIDEINYYEVNNGILP